MSRLSSSLLCGAMLVGMAARADADITISTDATQDMNCSGGICAPTAADAVLNVNDLESLLASGNVKVTTTGSGVQANDIVSAAGLSWSSASTLTLDAYKSVAFDNVVTVTGTGGLVLLTNDGGKGGALSFGAVGNVTFQNLSSALAINSTSYVLENSISGLANAIAQNPAAAYALAQSYDASADGTYTRAPIGTTFTGMLEGLGNTISNLSIDAARNSGPAGLFYFIDRGAIRDLGMPNAMVTGSADASGVLAGEIYSGEISNVYTGGSVTDSLSRANAGGLVGVAFKDKGHSGTVIANSHSTANVSVVTGAYAGGLVGASLAKIKNCYATGNVTGSSTDNQVGGLIGSQEIGSIQDSFATGAVITGDQAGLLYNYAGGLVGNQYRGSITNSYATGNVTGGAGVYVGGLVGFAQELKKLKSAYSIGAVTGGANAIAGGLVGEIMYGTPTFLDSYWDTDTSGQSQGTGNLGDVSGLSGLTTSQFQTRLPPGFGKKNWAENAGINGGFPYLLANPPQ